MLKRKIYHSTTVYKSKKDQKLIIFPYGFVEEGGPRSGINKPIVVLEPYTAEFIGKAVRDCYDIVINNRYTKDDMKVAVTEVASGIRNNSKFIREYLNVSTTFNTKDGYIISPWKQQQRGYGSFEGAPEFTLGIDATDQELGEAILKAFEYSE